MNDEKQAHAYFCIKLEMSVRFSHRNRIFLFTLCRRWILCLNEYKNSDKSTLEGPLIMMKEITFWVKRDNQTINIYLTICKMNIYGFCKHNGLCYMEWKC